MNTLIQDLRYGLRVLAKSPVFTAVAVLSLALGIGANTAIFSFVDKLLVRSLPVSQPQQLVNVASRGPVGDEIVTDTSFSYPLYADYRDQNDVLSGLAAYSDIALTLSENGQTERLYGVLVTGNYFDVLGVTPAKGRTFLPEEDQTPGARPVVVISHGLWQRHFGGEPSIINRTVELNGLSFTVIGITPPEFAGVIRGFAPDLYVPMMMQAQAMPRYGDKLNNRHFSWLNLFGRLKPGVSREQAQTSLTALAETLAATVDDKNIFPEIILSDGSKGENTTVRTELSTPLLLLMATVALVLLIACANVANLLLARATVRRKEIAVRLTIGASRWRLIRQLLTESLLLSLLGGSLGLLVAVWLADLLATFAPPVGSMSVNTRLDYRVLGFSMALTLLTGVIFGLAPALQASKTDLVTALKDGTGSLRRSKSRLTLRNVLVVAQIALALVVLVCAGLCIRSLRNLQAVDLGFEPSRLLMMSLDLASGGYKQERGWQFYNQLLERVSALPGVESTTLARIVPLGNSGMRNTVNIEGYTPPPNQFINLDMNAVGANYFTTLKMPMVSGRDFSAEDNQAGKKVVVINERAAHTYWQGENPLGKHITLSVTLSVPGGKEDNVLEIVGIVRDSKYRSITETPRPTMFVPVMQNYFPDLTLHVRTANEPQAIVAAVRREVQSLDANLPLFDVKTMEQQKSDSLYAERMVAILLAAFGILALLLAGMGIYGVMAYSVNQRSREIGIRMALGAQKSDVLQLIFKQGLVMIFAGIIVGLSGAFAVTRLLSAFLYGVSAVDLFTFFIVPLLLTGVALAACFVPARRAAKTDPMITLRYE